MNMGRVSTMLRLKHGRCASGGQRASSPLESLIFQWFVAGAVMNMFARGLCLYSDRVRLRAGIHALTVFAMLACCPCVQAATLTEGPLSVTVPDSVGEGGIFLVEVRLENQVETVSVDWLGRSTEVTMAKRGGVFQGQLLLGAGLGIKPGVQKIVVEAIRPNRRELVLGKIEVTTSEFPEQRLSLPPSMVTPSKQNLARIRREQAMIKAAMDTVTPRKYWYFPFERPVPGEVTSAFGLRRILNGQPRSPHRGIDFDAALGDEVHCASQGKVILTGDFYFNGKSVFVDHGQGVITMYFHLSRIDVAVNRPVERGQRLGLAGATGRATGPHLHFGMNILGQSVDPMPLFTPGSIFDRLAKEGS